MSLFDWDIVDIRTYQGATSQTASTILVADNKGPYVILSVSTSVPCQITVDGLPMFGSAGAFCSCFAGISGAINLVDPIPIPSGASVSITQVGTTTGVYLIGVGRLGR